MTLFLSPTLLHTQAEAHCSLLKRDVTHILCRVAINMERKLDEGFRANCLPNILEHELQRNPFYGFFYLLNGLSIGVLLGSTQVRFRATLFIVILHSKQKTLPRSFIEVVQSLKPNQRSRVLAGCMILMFSKFLNSLCFYHTRRCPKK